jgi:hypothetical protein
MKSDWWLAAAIVVVATFLAIYGYMAVLGIEAANNLIANPGGSFAGPEEIELARHLQPLVYAIAVEGILFGVLSIVLAVAVLRHQRWARRGLLIASIGLAATAGVLIAFAPHLWDQQGPFIGLCACYLWEWNAKRKTPSAP